MKNALFSGITDEKKDSDSDNEKKDEVKQPEEAPAEMNLLDFGGPEPTPSAGVGDLLGGDS